MQSKSPSVLPLVNSNSRSEEEESEQEIQVTHPSIQQLDHALHTDHKEPEDNLQYEEPDGITVTEPSKL
jgi:hypothetical protein